MRHDGPEFDASIMYWCGYRDYPNRREFAELEIKARSDKVLQDKAETQPLNRGKRETRRIGKAKVRLLESARQGRKPKHLRKVEARKRESRRIAKAKRDRLRFSTKNKANSSHRTGEGQCSRSLLVCV